MSQIITRINEMAGSTNEMKAIDANRYATKKTIAQGMLDIALLTANASQLKYVLQLGTQHQFYKLMLILISLSIVLQLSAGILLLVVSLIGLHKSETNRFAAEVLSHIIDGIIFLGVFCDIVKMNFDPWATVIAPKYSEVEGPK